MVLCRSYQNRKCVLGPYCKKHHFDIKNSIIKDVNEAINGKQWPLSCFGPFDGKPSMPYFIEDKSFEEVRMLFYESKLKNFFGQHQQDFNKDTLNAQNKMKSLLQMESDILEVVYNIFDTPSNIDNKEKSGFPFVFYSTTDKGSIFRNNETKQRTTVDRVNPLKSKSHLRVNKGYNFMSSFKQSKPIIVDGSNTDKNKFNIQIKFSEFNVCKSNPSVLPFQEDSNKDQPFILDEAMNPFKSLYVHRNNTGVQTCKNQTIAKAEANQMSKNIDKSIMDLILVDLLPYSVVEGIAFQRLQFADPTAQNWYIKKTDNYFRTSLMPETYNEIYKKVFSMMENAKWISFSINIQNLSNSSSCLLCFTAYFMVGTTRKKLVLASNILENDNKDKYISKKISEIITCFKLKEKLHICLAQNIETVSEVENLKPLQCLADKIEQTIQIVIFKQKDIQEIIIKCLKILENFEKSEESSKSFQTIQKKCRILKKALDYDVNKKWINTFAMLKYLAEQKTTINIYAAENLSQNEWITLSDIVDVLECFYEASIELCADDASLSLVIPLIVLLTSKLNENDDAPFKRDLKQAFNEIFNLLKNSPFLITATLLDPRFKYKYLNETQIQIAEKEMSDFLFKDDNKGKTKSGLAIFSEAAVKTLKGPITTVKKENPIENSLWKKHDLMLSPTETIENDTSKRELSLYMREPLKPRCSNIYEYWHRSLDANLKKVAIKYLSAPPTTITNEKFFSAGKRLFENGMTNLQDVDIEKILFCHYNIQLLNFDY